MEAFVCLNFIVENFFFNHTSNKMAFFNITLKRNMKISDFV